MIYFVQDRVSGLIKIGFTACSVEERLCALQTGCPGELVLLFILDGDQDCEREHHETFAAFRERGEWFRPTPEFLAGLFTLVQEYGHFFGHADGFQAGWVDGHREGWRQAQAVYHKPMPMPALVRA